MPLLVDKTTESEGEERDEMTEWTETEDVTVYENVFVFLAQVSIRWIKNDRYFLLLHINIFNRCHKTLLLYAHVKLRFKVSTDEH